MAIPIDPFRFPNLPSPNAARLEAIASLYQEGKIDFATASQLSDQPNSASEAAALLEAESVRHAAPLSKLIDRPARRRARALRFAAEAPQFAHAATKTARPTRLTRTARPHSGAKARIASGTREPFKKAHREGDADTIVVRSGSAMADGPYADTLARLDRVMAAPFGVRRDPGYVIRADDSDAALESADPDTWTTQGAEDETRIAGPVRRPRADGDRLDEEPTHRYLKTGTILATPKDDERPIDFRPLRARPPVPTTTRRLSLRDEIAQRIPFGAPAPEPVRYDDLTAQDLAGRPLDVDLNRAASATHQVPARTTAAAATMPDTTRAPITIGAGPGPRSAVNDRFHRAPAL